MTKTLDTLIEDMQKVLTHEAPAVVTLEGQAKVGAAIANHLDNTLTPRTGVRAANRIWFSQLGARCHRKVWYEIHYPEKAEPLNADTKFKFLYGNVLEELVLRVAEVAGHKVERQQERIEFPVGEVYGAEWSVTGRIDAVIDGHVVDVKSMSTYSFKEQPDDLDKAEDMFGYKWQLRGYHDIIGDFYKDATLLCVDKQLGHMKLSRDYGRLPDPSGLGAKAGALVLAVGDVGSPPPRQPVEPMGKGGNMKLGTVCSYCPFKHACWPGLRTFLYANKPVFLTEVVEVPKVPELHDHG